MIIKKLELQGFKSFPERTKVVFTSGITAIVGPNGTGKSNIVDAILWVLGGQRQKGLRGEKTEDIIFNGNAKKPALGMAEVGLALEHQQEEIAISHRAFRSGESEYRLNGKAARLKDIQDALWKRAVAEKEYFVIEQGSVGTILTTKPAEKRALLEEAAGTAFFKDKKREAESKLASSEQNLIRLEDIISEVTREKNSLQRQAQAAVRYRKLREKTRELTGLNFRRKLFQLEHRHAEVTRSHTDALTQEKDIASRIKASEKELSDRRREVWEHEMSIKEGQEALYEFESHLSRAEAEREREAKRAELLLENIKRSAVSAEELEKEIALLDSEAAGRQQTWAEIDRALQEKKSEEERAAAASRTVHENFPILEKNIEDLKSGHLQTLFELSGLRNEWLKGDKELEFLTRQESRLAVQIAREDDIVRAKEESLHLLDGELAEARTAIESREKNSRELKASLETHRSAAAVLGDRLAEGRKIEEGDRYKLQALRKMEDSRRGPGEDEALPEALGLLAELIEADASDALLIDTLWKEEAGLPVIPALDFLRRAAERPLQGRYILVSPNEGPAQEPPEISDPAVLGSLKARLRPSAKIAGYRDELRDAMIVRDIRSAIELWLRQPALNFITPGGDLLLSSGLLKIGRQEEGAFALGQEIRRLEEALALRTNELAPLAAELEEKKKEIAGLEEEVSAGALQIEELGKHIHELEKKRIAALSEHEKAAGTVALLRKEQDVLRQDMSALSCAREELRNRISGLEADELAQKSHLEAGEREFSAHRGKTIEEEKRTIELHSDIVLLEERLGHLTGQINEIGQRKEALGRKIASLREEAEAAGREEAQAREAATALQSRLKTQDEERESRRAGVSGKEAELLRKRTEAETLDKELAEAREELERKKEGRVKWEIAKAEIDRDMVNLEETCWQELKKTLHELKNEKPEIELSDAEIEEKLAEAEEDLQRIKTVNLMAEEEYTGVKERFDFLIRERDDLRQSIDSTQEAIRKIDEESQTQFLAALSAVNTNFQEIFTLLFKGGSAEVRLLDAGQVQESGIEIVAQPPGKKVQNVHLLSGGEKSLTSLAFLFALFRYKPTPFCILDEVDAALDDVNLTRFLDLMKEIKKDTQFIIITHNYKTMEVADYIYGTTMAEPNITKLYSMKLEKQQELAQ